MCKCHVNAWFSQTLPISSYCQCNRRVAKVYLNNDNNNKNKLTLIIPKKKWEENVWSNSQWKGKRTCFPVPRLTVRTLKSRTRYSTPPLHHKRYGFTSCFFSFFKWSTETHQTHTQIEHGHMHTSTHNLPPLHTGIKNYRNYFGSCFHFH